jgi:DNA-binding LytR/AlgR family response regulator
MTMPDKPKALLADDEDLPRQELGEMLRSCWPALEVVAECEDGPAAVEAIDHYQPDVAFLDIRMPGMSGLDVARAASGRCHIVFTTAYDSHAVAAFEAGAADYLLKPVQTARLQATVQRLQERMATRSTAPALDGLVQQLALQLRPPVSGGGAEKLRWVSASVGESIKLFGIDEILFFQSDEKYTRVVTAHDEAHIRKPLKEIMAGLDPEDWWQIHRGAVVRASAVARAQRDDLGRITLQLRQHAEKLAVSQAWAWRFKPM